MDKPIAWYDPTNGAVSTDKDSPLFTPLGQVLPLFLEEQQITADCPNCEYQRKRAQLWRDEAYKLSGHPLPEQDGECKHCADGCPACDARKLPEQEPVAFINVEQRKLEWAKYMRWDTPTVVNLPKIPLYTTPPQRTWVGLMRGVRVEGNAVVITVKGGNDEARALCGELINEMEKNT